MLFLFRYRSKNKVGTQFEEKGFTNLNKNLKHCSACCYYEFYWEFICFTLHAAIFCRTCRGGRYHPNHNFKRCYVTALVQWTLITNYYVDYLRGHCTTELSQQLMTYEAVLLHKQGQEKWCVISNIEEMWILTLSQTFGKLRFFIILCVALNKEVSLSATKIITRRVVFANGWAKRDFNLLTRSFHSESIGSSSA